MEVIMKIRVLIILIAILLLSGCAVTLTDFNDLKARVDELEKKQAEQPQVKPEPAQNEEISTLIQQNQHIFSQLQAINNRLVAVENKMKDSNNSTADYQPAPVKAETPVAEVHETVQETSEMPAENINVDEYYNEGRRLYEIKDFPGAIKVFALIVQNHSDHSYAGPSQYWIGECYYGLGDFSAAKAEFDKVVQKYPSSTKFIDAQLKIALCYMSLNQKDKAKSELQRIKNTYPKYERISVINDYLKKL
jgi:tol-pal system protein YbgF